MIFESNDSISSMVKGTRLARIGETSIHSIIIIQILLIDLDWTDWNELGRSTVCRFGISVQYSIIRYYTK